jgi:hypothetical protein
VNAGQQEYQAGSNHNDALRDTQRAGVKALSKLEIKCGQHESGANKETQEKPGPGRSSQHDLKLQVQEVAGRRWLSGLVRRWFMGMSVFTTNRL